MQFQMIFPIIQHRYVQVLVSSNILLIFPRQLIKIIPKFLSVCMLLPTTWPHSLTQALAQAKQTTKFTNLFADIDRMIMVVLQNKFDASDIYAVLEESVAGISSFKRPKFCSLSNPAAKLPRPSPATKTFTLMHTATKVDERDTTLDNGFIRNLSKICKVTSLGVSF